MFQSIWEDIKSAFKYGNMVTRIIFINCIVFIVSLLISIFFGQLGTKFLQHFYISGDLWTMLKQPWGIFSYMFMHDLGTIFHILWNMIIFYWFGRIFGDLVGDRKVWPLYLLAGLGAAVVFYLYSWISGNHGYALGASGAVLAFVSASATLNPDHLIRLPFIGSVKIKFIAIVVIVIDLISVNNNINIAGGAFGHLGGTAVGMLFVNAMRQGYDLSGYINGISDNILNFFTKKEAPKPKRKKQHKAKVFQMPTIAKGKPKSDSETPDYQEKLDLILDKINEQGYNSLTDEEKDFLSNAGKED